MVVAQCLQTERCSEISSSPCFVNSSTQFHSCAMMGLQATSGKRKLEGGVGCMDFDMELGESPSKLGRVEASWWAMDDSYASSPTASYYDMEVVAPPCLQSSASCQLSSSGTTASTPSPSNMTPNPVQQQQQQSTTTGSSSLPTSSHQQHHQQQQSTAQQHSQQQQQSNQQHYYSQRPGTPQVYPSQPQQQSSQQSSQQQQTTQQQQQQQLSRLSQQQPGQWGHHAAAPHHYEPPTIRREENGKSYLELGSSYRANERCCEGSRASWCRRGRACYRQRRSAVWSISMFKLSRFRQFPDPSLHRSVLICNTLRYIEREMDRDRSPPPMEPVMPAPMTQLQPMEQGRLTPFPMQLSSSVETDVDSGIGDSDDSRSINWGSVLSLSSQSPLDPLNNNELLDVDIGPELDLDFMPGWKLTPLTANSTTQSTQAATTTTTSSTTIPAASTTTSTTLVDELLRPTSSESVLHHHNQHQHHNQQQQQLLLGCSSSNSSSNSSSASGSSSSTTHESLMCVGS